MKYLKRIISLVMLITLVSSFCSGCGGGTAHKENVNYISYTDSCDRTVEIPETIESVVPSGSLAQMFLLSLCPEKMVALSSNLSKTQKKYFGEGLEDLPVIGSYYGSGSTMNLEAMIGTSPDIIIDIGESKQTIAEDMDSLTSTTKVPAIFILGDINSLSNVYRELGKLLDVEERAEKIASYIDGVLQDIEEKAATISDEDRVRVMYADGDTGQDVKTSDSIHAEIITMIGAENVAEVYTDGDVSMEQIILWDPDIIILSPDANYDEIFDDQAWSDLTAVKEGRVYEVPYKPYNWIDKPPSVQRVLGIQWLAQVVYPDVYNYDMVEKAQEYFELFYGYDLSDEEAEELMQYSLYKE